MKLRQRIAIGHYLIMYFVDWRRWSIGISWDRYYRDWHVYLPVIQITVWKSLRQFPIHVKENDDDL